MKVIKYHAKLVIEQDFELTYVDGTNLERLIVGELEFLKDQELSYFDSATPSSVEITDMRVEEIENE